MKPKKVYLGLDVGEKRIGVAVGDNVIKIASPLPALMVDGEEITAIKNLVEAREVSGIVIGHPRNQSGETTKQTEACVVFSNRLKESLNLPIYFQDESLTSVMAEERLSGFGKPYQKANIDSEAAAIILQDYLDAN